MKRLWLSVHVLIFSWTSSSPVFAEDFVLHSFRRQSLTDVYYSEGAAAGDLNNDGHPDVVYGPHWYAGPDFTARHEIYPAVPQPRERYADHFFAWVFDFDGDGWKDILTAGFPGTPGFVYQNPGREVATSLWEKIQVADSVSNEAPQFADLTGDGVPELICTREGHYGFYRRDPESPLKPWSFVSVSAKIAPIPFGHGLGVGDLNADGRLDLLARDGWMEQPVEQPWEREWVFHRYPFAPASADMFAVDADGDGDADVVTSLHAHEYGLAWFENTGVTDGEVTFTQHLIVGRTTADSPYGILFTEPHALRMADINGDGLQDIVTGKTYWSHHRQSPMWDAGAVVYWFELKRMRDEDGHVEVDWVPHLADGESGVGRGLAVEDLNGDGHPDIIAGGMVGGSVLINEPKTVTEAEYLRAQPQRQKAMASGLLPSEAAEQMSVPAGFQVQLAAGEPQVHQPIAMCYDHRGRLWVAEAHTYPQRAAEGTGKDRIMIFEDTTGDGVLDHAKTFIEGLNLVSGLEVGYGGVFVGAPPYLMFIPDIDHDDVPDKAAPQGKGFSEIPQQGLQFPGDVPQGAIVIRDGFGWHDTHETLNAFIWGPDGWLYGCHGVFTHSRAGHPGTADSERIPLNAAVWRYHPIRDVFEPFMHGTSNPWGVDFNDRGQAFITACVIPHLWHVIQGARYQRQGGQHFNPYTYEDIGTIADHAHYVGNIRDHAWWGHEPQAAGATLDAGGGHAHCGAMIYLGDNWPEQYRNRIYFNNVHGNRVNCDVLEQVQGSSAWVGHHGQDLLVANDHYFRGINLRYGPDGTVLLIDWYDKNACHRTNPEIWDRTNGRIYRVAYGQPTPVSVDASKWTEAELLQMHFHRNEWFSRMATRQLMERGCSEQLAGDLWSNASDSDLQLAHRLRCLWSLHAVRGLSADQAVTLLQDSDAWIRSWTIQLELEDLQVSDELLARLEELAEADDSAVVRLYLSSALQRISVERRAGLATALAAHAEDSTDHNLPLMLWYGIEPLVVTDPAAAMRIAAATPIEKLRRFIVRRAASDNQSLPAVIQLVADTNNAGDQLLILEEVMAACEGRVDIPMPDGWKEAYPHLQQSAEQPVRDRADQLAVLFGDQRVFGAMRSLLADQSVTAERRRQALEVLVRGQDKEASAVLLSPAVLGEAALQGPAVRALAALGNTQTPGVLLRAYADFPVEVKADAIGTLVSRPLWVRNLLQAMASGEIRSADLHAYHVRQILTFEDAELNELLQMHWGEIRASSADRQEQLEAWKKKLTSASLSKANLGNGRRVFAKTCQNCHRLFGTGGQIGPDITGSNRANLEYILENILDPSAVVGRDYQVTVLALTDGRVVQGMLRRETDSALTVQTLNDQLVIPLAEIEERTLSPISMMPERQLDALSEEEVRDLVAYLSSPVQVILSGPDAPIDTRTGRVESALEGEKLKIVEKTAGRAVSQPMGNFRAARWSGADQLWWTGAGPGDRLAVEVEVPADGQWDVELVLTRARDYGVFRVTLGDKVLDAGVDLFNSEDVITTGVLIYGGITLQGGSQRLTFEITGANPQAVKSYMLGLDYVRLVPAAVK